MKIINNIAKYAFGFSFLGGRTVYRFVKKVIKGAYKNVHAVLPFLSQKDLLNWSEKVIDGVDGIYDLFPIHVFLLANSNNTLIVVHSTEFDKLKNIFHICHIYLHYLFFSSILMNIYKIYSMPLYVSID